MKFRCRSLASASGAFTLTNQDGNPTTLTDLTNRVWVADIIFTRCAGQCPRMTQQMKSLEEKLPPGSGARLVTLTTDPDYDSPVIMKRYGDRFRRGFQPLDFFDVGPRMRSPNSPPTNSN